jgi:UDP-GlcNAc:undecaprenyl-phosphate GlcNAc-1-phosphate transferase
MNAHFDWLAFTVALFASFAVTVPVRKLALRTGMVDRPGPRKVHAKPMPLLGGMAIYAGFVVAVLLSLHNIPEQEAIGILTGATLVLLVGLLDDGGLLHHQVKLFIGMPVAAVLLLVSGIRADFFSNFVPGQIGAALDVCFTVVWVVGITAAFSILDHMDGLCAGIAAVAAGFFTIAASMAGQTMVRTLAAAVLGASLGFLRWNFNPAKIFMGDGGAMLLGFLMATLGLKLRPADAHFPLTWLAVALILGVPIFDTTLISISRSRRGLLPFTSPGKDHTAHRLSNLGLGHRGAVVALYGFALCCGTLALLVSYIGAALAYALTIALIGCILAAILRLESVPFEHQAKLHKPSPAP